MTEQDNNVVVTIKDKTEKQGNTNGKNWTRLIFDFGSFKASTFDEKLKSFKAGDTVKVLYTQDGAYRNIKSMELADSGEIKRENAPNESVWLEKDKRIVRQNCNQRAIEMLALEAQYFPEDFKALVKEAGSLTSLTDMISKHFENKVWE